MQYLIIITQNTAFFICQFLIISHNCKLTICKSLKFPKGVHEPKTKTKQTPSNMGSPAPATLMLKQSWGFSWLSDYSPLPSCLPRSSFIYTLGLRTARGVCSPVTLSACWPVGREVCGRHQRAGRCVGCVPTSPSLSSVCTCALRPLRRCLLLVLGEAVSSNDFSV